MSRPIAVVHPLADILIRYYRCADKSRQEKFKAELQKLRSQLEAMDKTPASSPRKAPDATLKA